MKFINYLSGITDIGIYPLISLLIFFVFFTALIVYIFRADKTHLKYMSDMPLANEPRDVKNESDL